MTLKEFLNFCELHPQIKGKESVLELTVRKHDKNQLTCYTTVPIDRVELGFDWTHNQVVLHPSIKLSTEQGVLDENLRKSLKNEYERRTETLKKLAEVSRLCQEIQDGELRDRIHNILKSI
jgi:hypothetical protein